ncbi:MAG: PaaI family thioesterase, partial [Acidobacteria bacterium]
MRRHYDDGCFACGRENPLGLHLDGFSLDDGVVSARFDPREEYRGAGISLHGGVAATALDEMLVWAGILDLKVMSVTG